MIAQSKWILIWKALLSLRQIASTATLAIFRSRRPSVSWIFAPKTFCLMKQLFGLGATNSFGLGAPCFEGHKLPQSLWISVVKITVAALKLQVSGVAILSVRFLIHASSSTCICLVWRICMMPDAFLMCAASASVHVLAEPFWKAPRSRERSSHHALSSFWLSEVLSVYPGFPAHETQMIVQQKWIHIWRALIFLYWIASTTTLSADFKILGVYTGFSVYETQMIVQ